MHANQFSPELPTVVAEDHGKVRLGGYSPSLPRKAETADKSKVRLGGYGPTLPR